MFNSEKIKSLENKIKELDRNLYTLAEEKSKDNASMRY
jgi:hypothetical protein